MGGDYASVAEQFIPYYYNTFDSDRRALEGLYRDNSVLTFESSQTEGAAAIAEKLAGLSFVNVKHEVQTKDAQPAADGAILVLVTGVIEADGSPFKFAQTFVLMQDGGSYYVANDVFKLIYG
ncbi:nuclear transport factor 2 family protein [Nonomuraea sp. NPDC000554]|uniref:nuclear transport factor 2 family protein n=1 Tax=Nonomuraea sp. NPDC000554 TaxID=3154259 RepID=UPI00333256D1